MAFDLISVPGLLPSVEPAVDGEPLKARAERFEREAGYKPYGGYVGLHLGSLDGVPVDAYFLGAETRLPGRPDGLFLLACGACGEAECWPLAARVTVTKSQVEWSTFVQPHRRAEWSYDGLGPFVFDRHQYEAALARLVVEIGKVGTG